MEKLTIAKLGEQKNVSGVAKATGKPYSFNKIGFQTNETPDRWYDFTFNGNNTLEVGKAYEFEVTSRDYNGKTYYEAKFPKNAAFKPTGDILRLEVKIDAVMQKQEEILKLLRDQTPAPEIEWEGPTDHENAA